MPTYEYYARARDMVEVVEWDTIVQLSPPDSGAVSGTAKCPGVAQEMQVVQYDDVDQ